jgi:hypothetical protein
MLELLLNCVTCSFGSLRRLVVRSGPHVFQDELDSHSRGEQCVDTVCLRRNHCGLKTLSLAESAETDISGYLRLSRLRP